LRSSAAFFAVLLIPAILGCRGPSLAGTVKPQAFAVPLVEPQKPIASTTTEVVAAERTFEEALDEVLEELTKTGALDAKEKQPLMADLSEAKRENWPLIVQQFQSALAYRQQLAGREAKADAGSLATEKKSALVVAKQMTQPPAANSLSANPSDGLVKSRSQAVPASLETPKNPSPSTSLLAETVVPNTPLVLTKPPQVLQQKVAQQQQKVAQHIHLVSTSQQPHDWHVHLQNSIQDLQVSVQSTPGSTDEVNQHMRLRLLQLLAGNEEAALQPVPGATAPQQDYWNKQLFAVSTFLDSQQQPDDRRRAAGSLMYLDQARAKLAEMATLEIRNLAFVDSVDGYGTYELHEKTKFRPGDVVTLYAEIENFSCESTKEGYRTRLGTSYEVVDKSGKRVDSAQFPEVEDLCQNPRRDFHMQYTVTLPTRIYAEQYEIKLTITDQQSHKIGQASVSFEISE